MQATVYILRCADGSYYGGLTRQDAEARAWEHNNDPIDSYTAKRRPVTLVFQEVYDWITDAIARERQIKGWNRAKKEALIRGDYDALPALASRHSKPEGRSYLQEARPSPLMLRRSAQRSLEASATELAADPSRLAAARRAPQDEDSRGWRARLWATRWLRPVLLALGPVLAALVVAGAVLLALEVNPLDYYAYVLRRGLISPSGLQATLTRMAPLLLIAASLIVAFRAGIWNLGGDGQFLLAAVAVAAVGPALAESIPVWLMLVLCFGLAALVGAAWSLLPALLKAYQGVNEIVTTLMMTFLGISFANVLVKLAFLDPATTVPQTRTLPVADRLPRLFGTTVSSGLLIGLAAVIVVHLVMTRTAFGLRLRVVGASTRAAVHAGLSVPRLTLAVFAISAGLAGLAGAVEILGVQGYVRADWNPAYGLAVVPLVFLARFNGFASIAFVFLFSVLSIGGESAARRLGVPNYFTLVVVAILLILLALAEYLDHRYRETAELG